MTLGVGFRVEVAVTVESGFWLHLDLAARVGIPLKLALGFRVSDIFAHHPQKT